MTSPHNVMCIERCEEWIVLFESIGWMNECDFLIVIYKAIPARMECILLNKEMINCRFFFLKVSWILHDIFGIVNICIFNIMVGSF